MNNKYSVYIIVFYEFTIYLQNKHIDENDYILHNI